MGEFRFTGGLPETACGLGSTLRFTEHLRAVLPGWLRRLDVRTLLDAPCGDFNWMAHVDLSHVRYIGGDIDAVHLSTARENQRKAGREASFIRLDLLNEPPPKADLMLCRDFLQHLPNTVAVDVLRGFLRSGTSWLLATSHVVDTNGDIDKVGGFRPLDLCKSPINLPPPSQSIEDGPGSGRILGLWHRRSIEAAVSQSES